MLCSSGLQWVLFCSMFFTFAVEGDLNFSTAPDLEIVKSENIRKINLKHIVTLKHMIAKRIILVVFEIQHDADMGALHI